MATTQQRLWTFQHTRQSWAHGVLLLWGWRTTRERHLSVSTSVVTIPPSKWTRYCGQTPGNVNVLFTRLTVPRWVLHSRRLTQSISLPELKAATCQVHPSFQISSQISRKSFPLLSHHCKHDGLSSDSSNGLLICCHPHFFLTLNLSGLVTWSPSSWLLSCARAPGPNLLAASSHSDSTKCSRLSTPSLPSPGSATSSLGFLVPLVKQCLKPRPVHQRLHSLKVIKLDFPSVRSSKASALPRWSQYPLGFSSRRGY